MAAGHSSHPMRLPVNTVIHITLVGLEPATFRSLVDCWSDALPVVPPAHQVKSKHGSGKRPTTTLSDCSRCVRHVVRPSSVRCSSVAASTGPLGPPTVVVSRRNRSYHRSRQGIFASCRVCRGQNARQKH